MILGAIDPDAVRDLARFFAGVGAPGTDWDALLRREHLSLQDLPTVDHVSLAAVNRRVLEACGGYLVSSGGTTDRPKFSYVPHHQGARRVAEHWRPLGPGDVMLNLFAPGRTWAAHYFYNQLAEECGTFTIPMGPMEAAEVAEWCPTLASLGVTALAGTPTSIAEFLSVARQATRPGAAGGEPAAPGIRKIIWVGEPLDDACRAEIARWPQPVGVWGNYGSIETFVIATNTPECPPDVLHLLPGQALELGLSRPLLTRAGDGWTTRLLRYPLGDLIEPARCPCGKAAGLRVLGRADDQMKFCGTLISIGQVREVLAELPEVADAQMHLCSAADDKPLTAVVRMAVRVRLRDGYSGEPAQIRSHLLTRIYDLGFIAGDEADAIDVSIAGALPVNARTGKTERLQICGPARPCPSRSATVR